MSESAKYFGFALIAASCVLAGCGNAAPDRAEVRGEVSADGQPIDTGAINFIPIDVPRGQTVGAMIAAGKYHIPPDKGPFPGKYRVEVRATRKTGRKIKSDMAPYPEIDEIQPFIPDKYNSKSKQTIDLHEGLNDSLNFDLELK